MRFQKYCICLVTLPMGSIRKMLRRSEVKSCLVPVKMTLKQFDSVYIPSSVFLRDMHKYGKHLRWGGDDFSQFVRSRPTEGPASHRGWLSLRNQGCLGQKHIIMTESRTIFWMLCQKNYKKIVFFFRIKPFLNLLTCWEETMEDSDSQCWLLGARHCQDQANGLLDLSQDAASGPYN